MEKPGIIVTVAQDQPADYIPEHCEVQPQYVYESNIHNNILATLNEQRRLGLLCDMTVIVEGVELQAHKAILAACSSYFNGIITDPANVSHNIVLELSSISRVGMECLLEFAYTSKLTVSRENINHVLAAARELDVKNLEYSCLNLLKQKLFQESSDPTVVSQSTDCSKACKNSTISRKMVPAIERSGVCQEVVECCMEAKPSLSAGEDCKNSKGDCPLMAKLSLNSTPTPPDVTVTNNVPVQTADFKPIAPTHPTQSENINICSLPKAQQQLMLQHYLQQQSYRLSSPCPKSVQQCDQSSYNSLPSRYFYSNTCPKKATQEESTYDPDQPLCTISYKSKCGLNYNSDTDEALSADDDSEKSYKWNNYGGEACGKLRKLSDVVLPFSINEITKLPRTQLQELLNRNPTLTAQQITAIHEIRRRGKNRIAAQRCRKRKMDCIRSLQCQLEQLRAEHSSLMGERRNCREDSLKLAEMFQTRYNQIFSDLKQCKQSGEDKETNDPEQLENAPGDHIVASMSDYFKAESNNARELAERFCKLPCSTLPPFSLCSVMSQACPMMSQACTMMSSPCHMISPQNVVLVCDDNGIPVGCNKPCSPCSPSYSNEVTEAPTDHCPTPDDDLPQKSPDVRTNPMEVDTPRVYLAAAPDFQRPT
uniref:BTB domain-containing protein n=1 Tax=Ciona savignyi TaxID=51511 RepID=H2YYI8_CIOSA